MTIPKEDRPKILPAEKQLELIKLIEEQVSVQFKGDTKIEASEYISKYLEKARLNSMDEWCLNYM